MSDHPYYGKEILRDREQEYIQKLLKKYKGFEVNDDLKEKIWNELQMEKHLGHITIPFKLVKQQDLKKRWPDYLEVILDTKV